MPVVAGEITPRLLELCELLIEAENHIRSQPRERLMDGFSSNARFADFIRDTRLRLQQNRSSWLARRKLQWAFAPTSDWDDCDGDAQLGDRIFSALFDVYGWWR